MAKPGLFASIFGGVNHAANGIFNVLFNRDGSYSPIHRTDIRLGDIAEDQEVSFFSKTLGGLPYWLIAIFLVGFIHSYRAQKKSRK